MTESTFDPLFEATVAERRRLDGLLSELTKEQWAHHSLCKGWRVREVVAHITAAYRLTPETVMAGVAAAAGDWNAACDVLAKRDTAQYSDAELLASLAEPHRPTPRGERLRMVDGRRRRRRRSTRGRPPPEDRRETSALTRRATGAGEPDQGRYSWTPGAGECD